MYVSNIGVNVLVSHDRSQTPMTASFRPDAVRTKS